MSTRRLKRHHLLFYLPVTDVATGERLGKVVDITTEGLMLVSEKAVETGQELKIRIDLPQTLNGRLSIRLRARSVWSRPDPNPSLFDTGLCFVRVSPRDAQTIRSLIERFAFED